MSEVRNNLIQLMKLNWNGKAVWESIRDKELTSSLAFKGELYDTANVRIMYVGHAVNGWEIDVSKCNSLESTVDTIMSQSGALESFVNKEGYPYIGENGKTRTYYHIHSKFIRLIKQILEYQNESDSPTTFDTWYDDTKEWYKKIVWSNLYNIAPREGGNPDDQFIKMGMKQYTEIIRNQIEEYRPDIVLFCPLSGYFVRWKKEPSFDEILDTYEECNIDNTIIGKGTLKNSQIIVCKRPDSRGRSYDDVQKMAKIISDYINRNEILKQ